MADPPSSGPMKHAREAGGSSSASRKKKRKMVKPPPPPPLPPVVPLDIDFERNWKDNTYRGRMITPEVRNQGKKPTCGLHVVGQVKEMEDNRYCVIKGQPFHFRLDLRRSTSDFEVATGVPLEKFQGNFLKRALRLKQEKGIPVEGTEDYLKISGYDYQETMSFDEIAAILEEGRPVITGFKIDKSFGRLKGKQNLPLPGKKGWRQ